MAIELGQDLSGDGDIAAAANLDNEDKPTTRTTTKSYRIHRPINALTEMPALAGAPSAAREETQAVAASLTTKGLRRTWYNTK